MEVFQKVSPSVFVVQSLDENGKALMLGSGVAFAAAVYRERRVPDCCLKRWLADKPVDLGLGTRPDPADISANDSV